MITDLYTYFAKFPDIDGVKKNFSNTASKMAEWAEMKTEIDNMHVQNIIPEIKDFIFSINSEMIYDKIRSLTSYFMFVEYGQIDNQINGHNVKDTSIQLAITIARNFAWSNKDVVEETIISDKCLYYMQQIEKQMEADDKLNCSALKYLVFPATITPVEPMNFNGAIGWVMNFKTNASYTNYR